MKCKVINKNDLYFIKKANNRYATWKDFDKNTPFTTTPAVYQRKKDALKGLKKLEC